MTAPPYLALVLGPAEHGVSAHALDLATAGGLATLHLAAPSPPRLPELLAALAGAAPDVVHLHVTDRLCGATPEQAADLVVAVAERHRLTVTLHDLPQDSDGPQNSRRRALAYGRIAAAADGVQVSSEHERALLAQVAPGVAVTVVPLPVPRRTGAPHPGGGSDDGASAAVPTVGVLGFLYPGKGHAEVLAALDRIDRPDVPLVALGRPSDGHEHLVDDLRRSAGDREVVVTGYLDDLELDRQIARITVPVCAPSHVSASGSLHRWIGCGRRPVVLGSRYAREVEDALPGALLLTDDLPAALQDALAHPEQTWRTGAAPGWDPAAASAAQTAAVLAAVTSPARR